MKPQIVLYSELPSDQKQRLIDRFEVHHFNGITSENYLEFITALNEAKGLIGSSHVIDANILRHAPKLKAVSTISVGYDNFDLEYLTKHRVLLMHTPNVLTYSTADTIFSLILATARRIIEMANYIKDGKWVHSITPDCYGVDVHHKTIGILGMGRIGAAVAQRAHLGFDMKVLYMSNRNNEEVDTKYSARRCEIEELLSESDFVCITLPYNHNTEKIINKQRLALMKQSAILINGARGRIVDEEALIEALKNGVVRGAGLDVFEQEPLNINSPLLKLPNVVALPHIGSATTETRYKMAQCAVNNLFAALDGTANHNVVNSHLLDDFKRY